jgi:hypothetical protein
VIGWLHFLLAAWIDIFAVLRVDELGLDLVIPSRTSLKLVPTNCPLYYNDKCFGTEWVKGS